MTMELEKLKPMKARHKVRYGADFTERRQGDLEKYANVDDVSLKRANPTTTLEGFANVLIADSERLEIERIRANPPVYDRTFVEHVNPYSIMSLYSDFKTAIEGGLVTWDHYRIERRKWRKCKHMFCINMFPIDKTNCKMMRARRKDSRYCSDACRVNHRDAKRRYAKTGSCLPEWWYLPNMSESVGDRTRRNEFASEGQALERRINEQARHGNRRKPRHKIE